MQPWIRDLLEQVDELFPPERIARSKARWRCIWKGGAPDRYPFVYYPCTFAYYDDVHTPEERLRCSLEEFLVHGRMNDDFIPSLFPGCRQGTLPSMLGAREIVAGGDYTCERIIQGLEDIDRLPEPSMAPGTIAHEWIEMQRYFLEETEGRIPVHVTDMQGPFDAAAQLWGYDNLFIAAYQYPESYERLIGRTTRAFIQFWRAQAELAGDLFVGTHLFGWDWAPPGLGATLSADSLAMGSPDFFETAYRPHLDHIAEELGGLTVHSCGDFTAVIPQLATVPGVRGVNAGQMSVQALIDAGWPPEKVIIAYSSYEEMPGLMQLVRNMRLRTDVSIFFPWPMQDECIKPPREWSAADWDDIRRKEDALLGWMA